MDNSSGLDATKDKFGAHQDLIERLRTRARVRRSIMKEADEDRTADLLDEAADVIERLRDDWR